MVSHNTLLPLSLCTYKIIVSRQIQEGIAPNLKYEIYCRMLRYLNFSFNYVIRNADMPHFFCDEFYNRLSLCMEWKYITFMHYNYNIENETTV